MKKIFSHNLMISIISLFLTHSLSADSGAWSISAANLFWDNSANWTGAMFPDGIGEAAAFIGAPSTSVIDSTQDITIGSLHFDVVGNSITVGFTNNSLTFDKSDTLANQANIFIASSQSHYLNTPVILNSDLVIHAGTSSSLDLSQPISGNHSVTIMVDQSTHIQSNAAHTYTGGTFIESGYLDLNGPSSTINVPGDITIFGSGALKHGPGTSNNYAPSSVMTVSAGSVDLNGTTQTIDSLIMRKQSIISGGLNGTLIVSTNNTNPALFIGGNSMIMLDTIVLENGGGIFNETSNPGAAFFVGIVAPSGFTTIDLNDNDNVLINANLNPFQEDAFAINFLNTKFINGSLEKIGSGAVIFEGDEGSNTLTDLTISSGTVQIGRSNDSPSIIDGPATITVEQGALLKGFGLLGSSGNVSIINNAGSVIPGSAFELGTLIVSDSYEQNEEGSLYIQGLDVANTSKLIVDGGTVSLDGTFFFVSLPGAQFNDGDEFVVIDNTGGTINGTFSNFVATLSAGLSASLIYTQDQVIMSISSCGECSFCLLPPSNLQVSKRVNYCLNQTDFVNRLSWNPSLSASVVKYNLYINEKLVSSIGALSPLTFDHHFNPLLAETYEYRVTAITESGEESAPITITVS